MDSCGKVMVKCLINIPDIVYFRSVCKIGADSQKLIVTIVRSTECTKGYSQVTVTALQCELRPLFRLVRMIAPLSLFTSSPA